MQTKKMVERRLFLIFFAITFLVLVSHAKRDRNDDLEVEEIDFVNDNTPHAAHDGTETAKHFLRVKKKGAAPCIIALPSRKSSVSGEKHRTKSGTTATSRYNRIRSRIIPTNGTCGVKNPCKNGGECRTLSRDRHYCFCQHFYYGKTCQRKFKGGIEPKKLFSNERKKTAQSSSSDAVSDLLEKTPPCIIAVPSRKSSVSGKTYRKKSDTTSTSRYNRIRSRIIPTKSTCGAENPCENGGICKTLSSGRYYCSCSQNYYGKTCENKFIPTGTANKDRAAIDHCARSPCRNGGECVRLRKTFYCRCRSPFSGIHCEKRIDLQ